MSGAGNVPFLQPLCKKQQAVELSTHAIFTSTPAVVVGLCGHGLAIVRALREGRVPVIALETNTRQPGVRTRLATVELISDINGPGLIDALLDLSTRIRCPEQPVLFLTNDTMVKTVGSHWDRLKNAYRLSWSHSRATLLTLLQKSALEARCFESGLQYPKTYVLESMRDAEAAIAAVQMPVIVKPSRPLAKFKTSQPESPPQLAELASKFNSDLPFLVQQFITGDDQSIFFCALYLDHGKVLARFDGHKLRSRPLGHTSIAEPTTDDGVFERTCRFFAGLELSGPVSLELKRDAQGGLWVIEPTVGRTDFWIDLCTINGVNLPLTEYCHQAGIALPNSRQKNAFVWINEERDPFGRLWFMLQKGLRMDGRSSSYLYLHRSDPTPGLIAIKRITTDLMKSLVRRIGKIVAR